MNNAGANNFEFESFKQLEYDYRGYQSLTDVPKASVYTEDIINIEVNIIRIYKNRFYIKLKAKKKKQNHVKKKKYVYTLHRYNIRWIFIVNGLFEVK